MDVFADVLDRQDRCEKTEDSNGSDDVQLMMEAEEQGALSLTLDVNGQYQFRADSGGQGAVTYRVVQVTQDDDGQAQVIGGLSSNQAILHGMANGDRLSEETSLGEARLAYIPAVSGLDTRQSLEAVNVSSSSVSQSSGPFYVMMTPSDILPSAQQRTIMPRLVNSVKTERGARASRDDRRRATHNEVERRRRDKINCWILQLGKLVPDFTADQAKQGDSKSVILAKACDHISDLLANRKDLLERLKEEEQLKKEAELLQRSCEELKQENDLMRAHLQEQGITDDQLNDLGL